MFGEFLSEDLVWVGGGVMLKYEFWFGLGLWMGLGLGLGLGLGFGIGLGHGHRCGSAGTRGHQCGRRIAIITHTL